MTTMTELQAIITNEDEVKKVFRAALHSQKPGSADLQNTLIQNISGKFVQGRTPFISVLELADGSSIRLKFVNTIKNVLNSKLVPTIGKESFLSYLEVSVFPAGFKGYSFTLDVNQVRWKTAKSVAEVVHATKIAALVAFADAVQIDLSKNESWCTVYSQTY